MVFVGLIVPGAIITGGIYFAFRLRFFALRSPLRFLKTLKDGDGSFKSLNLALAGTLGVGNVVGVVNAIRLGGAGSVLWMILSAIIASYLKYAEAYMAVKTRRRTGNKAHGGAYVYIREAFGKCGGLLSVMFCLCFVVNSLATGCILQASAVVTGVSYFLPENVSLAVSLALALLVAVSVIGGIHKISAITNKTVPIMSAVYLVTAAFIIILNAERIPLALSEIFNRAFAGEGVIYGVGAFMFTECMRCGIMRGLLSNEAGCGSSATAHATDPNAAPHKQGCMGIAEVLADTVIMCTVTALALLTSGAELVGENDVHTAISAFERSGGSVSSLLICICIAVFGYATLICFAGYGNECVSFLFKDKKKRALVNALFITTYVVLTGVSPYVSGEAVLLAADTSMGIMSVINIPALIRLSPNIVPE